MYSGKGSKSPWTQYSTVCMKLLLLTSLIRKYHMTHSYLLASSWSGSGKSTCWHDIISGVFMILSPWWCGADIVCTWQVVQHTSGGHSNSDLLPQSSAAPTEQASGKIMCFFVCCCWFVVAGLLLLASLLLRNYMQSTPLITK